MGGGKGTPSSGNSPAKPIAPLWVFALMNPIMRALLQSRLHRMVSGVLMLLSYTGQRSGKVYTIPIGYFVWDTDEVMAFSSARWWVNVRDQRPVTLVVKGQRVEATPTVIHEREAVIQTLGEFIRRLGVPTARKLMLGLPADRDPSEADLQAIPAGRSFIHFKIVRRPEPIDTSEA